MATIVTTKAAPEGFVPVVLDRLAHGEKMVNYKALESDYWTRAGGLMAFLRVYGRRADGSLTGGYNHKPYHLCAAANRTGATVYVNADGPTDGGAPAWYPVAPEAGAPADGIGYPRGVLVFTQRERTNAPYTFLGAIPTETPKDEPAGDAPTGDNGPTTEPPAADSTPYAVKVKGKAARPVSAADAAAALREGWTVVARPSPEAKYGKVGIDAAAADALLTAYPAPEAEPTGDARHDGYGDALPNGDGEPIPAPEGSI